MLCYAMLFYANLCHVNVLQMRHQRMRTAVFFFAMEAHIAARILIIARSKGMYNGDYAFIGNRLEWGNLLL